MPVQKEFEKALSVKVTGRDYDRLRGTAKKRYLSLSALVRTILCEELDRERV